MPGPDLDLRCRNTLPPPVLPHDSLDLQPVPHEWTAEGILVEGTEAITVGAEVAHFFGAHGTVVGLAAETAPVAAVAGQIFTVYETLHEGDEIGMEFAHVAVDAGVQALEGRLTLADADALEARARTSGMSMREQAPLIAAAQGIRTALDASNLNLECAMTAARGANADGLCAVVHGRVDTARYQTDLPYRHGVDFAREQSASDPAALKRQVDTIEGNRSLVQQQRSARIAG